MENNLPGETRLQLIAIPGRLDQITALLTPYTRSFLQKQIEEGRIFVDGRKERAGYRLSGGERIEICLPPPEPSALIAQDIPLSILYQDGDVAVIDKPQGLVVHPGAGNRANTLANALLYHLDGLSGIGGETRPGIVHRIDKDTSGLLIVAKNDAAHTALCAQLGDRSLGRTYCALITGRLREPSGTIDAPIGRSRADRKKMAVREGGRPARTHYRVLGEGDGFSLVEARLESGRTHQIRVHMAHIGHPVAGDPLYGHSKQLGLCGQALHASELRFIHPRTGKSLRFHSPLPPYFRRALNQAGIPFESILPHE